jgi:hypothetical protein
MKRNKGALIPVPQIGQRVELRVGDSVTTYRVTYVKQEAPIDEILIASEESEQTQEPQKSRAIIMNGKWKVDSMEEEHTLMFLRD